MLPKRFTLISGKYSHLDEEEHWEEDAQVGTGLLSSSLEFVSLYFIGFIYCTKYRFTLARTEEDGR